MTEPRTFKLPLFQGMQTVRLDADSIDYDWKSTQYDFHGTLPYENLRLKNRVMRRDKTIVPLVVVGALIFLSVVFLFPFGEHEHLVRYSLFSLIALVGALTRQLTLGKTIGVQIDPKPFGFRDQLCVPNNETGRAFLVELEAAWKTSLRRRFLIRDENWQGRINWLEAIGVLTGEEAALERSAAESAPKSELALLGNRAFN